MSTYQIRAMAVALWLVAIVLAIPFAAGYETYTLYRDGTRVTATVRDKAGQPRSAEFVYDDRGPRAYPVRRAQLARLAAGEQVALLLHANTRAPILVDALADEKPSPLLPLGSALLLVAGVLVWRLPNRAAKRRAALASPREAIIEAAARTRNVSFGIGAFLVLAAGGFAVIPLFDRDATVAAIAFIEGLAAVSLGLGALIVARGIRLRDPRRNEIVRLIYERPRDIAWFYVHRVKGKLGSESVSAHIWKTDGKLVMVSLLKEDLDAVMTEIARRAPHAKGGFDPETQRMYKEQPSRWRPAA